MIYVDFTVPDGTIHRIENPVFTFVCLTCREKSLFQFADDYFDDMCTPCTERKKQEEKEAMRKKSLQSLAARINRG